MTPRSGTVKGAHCCFLRGLFSRSLLLPVGSWLCLFKKKTTLLFTVGLGFWQILGSQDRVAWQSANSATWGEQKTRSPDVGLPLLERHMSSQCYLPAVNNPGRKIPTMAGYSSALIDGGFYVREIAFPHLSFDIKFLYI